MWTRQWVLSVGTTANQMKIKTSNRRCNWRSLLMKGNCSSPISFGSMSRTLSSPLIFSAVWIWGKVFHDKFLGNRVLIRWQVSVTGRLCNSIKLVLLEYCLCQALFITTNGESKLSFIIGVSSLSGKTLQLMRQFKWKFHSFRIYQPKNQHNHIMIVTSKVLTRKTTY